MKHTITKLMALAIFVVFGLHNADAQGVAINTDGSAPDNSAMLDVSSTTKGFLPPRMTTAQIEAILNPADGLLVYNTDDGRAYIFVGSEVAFKDLSFGTSRLYQSCGIITDVRDNKTYNTVLIGDQCWMRQNLNVGTRVNGVVSQANNATLEKYCYDNSDANCDTYGGLYQWDEMMQYSTTQGIQGICPAGWHLPTDAEYTALSTYLGSDAGGKMKETGTTHWNSPNTGATNSSGFTTLPGGYRDTDGTFDAIGNNGPFWSSTQISTPSAWYIDLSYNNADVFRNNNAKGYGFSVRCVKDN